MRSISSSSESICTKKDDEAVCTDAQECEQGAELAMALPCPRFGLRRQRPVNCRVKIEYDDQIFRGFINSMTEGTGSRKHPRHRMAWDEVKAKANLLELRLGIHVPSFQLSNDVSAQIGDVERYYGPDTVIFNDRLSG